MEFSNHLLEPKQLRFFLETSTEAEYLEMSPRDWGDSSLVIKKDFKDFFANRRDFSLPFGFVDRGREMLRDEFKLNGISGKATLTIEILNPQIWRYEHFYSGRIDFAKADLNSSFIDVNFLDNDLIAKLKAFEGTDFEIHFETNKASTRDYDVRLSPIRFTEYGLYFLAQTGSITSSPTRNYGAILTTSLNDYVNRLGSSIFYEQREQQLSGIDFYGAAASDNYILANTKAGLRYRISGDMLLNFSNVLINDQLRGYELVIDEVWNDSDGNEILERHGIFDFRIYGAGQFVNFNLKVDRYFVSQNDSSRFYLSAIPNQTTGSGSAVVSFRVLESALTLSYVDYSPVSRTLSLTPKTLFEELMKKISGDNDIEVRSNFLELEIPELLISCGDAIRGMPDNEVVLQTSFKDFWKSISSIFDIGFDVIDGVPTIERKEYFFDPNLPIDNLGSVKDYSVIPATELIFNDIKVGYETQDYEAEEGKKEYNNGQTWKTPIEAGKNSMDLISPYRADSWGINEIREKFIFNPNRNELKEDNPPDNDIFFLWVDNSSFEPYTAPDLRQSFAVQNKDYLSNDPVIEGLPNNYPVYNFNISPKSNLLRHSRSLATSNFGAINQNKELVCTAFDKGNSLVFAVGENEYHSEENPIQVSSLRDPYFIPFSVTINVEFPLNLYKKFMADSRGFITFLVNGQTYKLFVSEISFNIIKRDDFEIKGYLCPDQDLSELFK